MCALSIKCSCCSLTFDSGHFEPKSIAKTACWMHAHGLLQPLSTDIQCHEGCEQLVM